MARKKAIEKSTPGKSRTRNETVIIRWELLDELIKAGLNGKEIAAKFEVHYDTLAKRSLKELNLRLSEYIRKSPERIIKEFDSPDPKGGNLTTWDKIDRMLEAGCLGVEIAATYGMSEEYFCKLMKMKYKQNFSDTKRMKKSKGDAALRIRQYDLAMKGDKQMLTILGKDRLAQVEKSEVNMNVKARVLTPGELKNFVQGLENEY